MFIKINKELFQYEHCQYIESIILALDDRAIDIQLLAKFYLDNFESDVEDVFLKHSSVWYEIAELEGYRLLQDLFTDAPNADYLNLKDNFSLFSQTLNNFINEYSLPDLLNCGAIPKEFFCDLHKLIHYGSITRSAFFNYSIFKSNGDIKFTSNNLYWIMGNTRDLPLSIECELLKKNGR